MQKKTTASPSVTTFSSTVGRSFHITKRGSSVAQEVHGGFVTFFTMAYALVVSPIIPSTTLPAEAGFAFADTAAGTALVADVITILMGLVANSLLTLATGMGLNAVVAFTLIGGNGLSYQETMGFIVWEDVLITISVLAGLRKAVFKAVPCQLETVISVGIGLFIAFVRLTNVGITRPGGTPVQLGINGSLAELPVLVFIFGLLLTVVLYIRKVKGVILIDLLSLTVLAMIFRVIFHVLAMKDEIGEIVNPIGWGQITPELSDSIVSLPNFDSLFQVDIFGVFSRLSPAAVVPLIFSLILAGFFDTMGAIVATGGKAKLLDENDNPPRSRGTLFVDSLVAIAGDVGGVSPNTSYIESSAGVGKDTRAGPVSVMTGLLLLTSTFLSPLVTLIPTEAASTALVFVGLLIMIQAADIDWPKAEIAIPAFPTTVFMSFAYPITVSIGVGFITYTFIHITRGQAKRVHLLMWLASILSIACFLLGPIEALID